MLDIGMRETKYFLSILALLICGLEASVNTNNSYRRIPRNARLKIARFLGPSPLACALGATNKEEQHIVDEACFLSISTSVANPALPRGVFFRIPSLHCVSSDFILLHAL